MKLSSRKDIEKRKNIFSLLILLLVLTAIPLTVFFLNQEQRFFILAAREEARKIQILGSEEPPEYIPGELLVTFKEKPDISKSIDLRKMAVKKKTNFSTVNKILDKYEIENITEVTENVYKINFPSKPIEPQLDKIKKESQLSEAERLSKEITKDDIFPLIRELQNDSNVTVAGPNYVVEALGSPDDPDFGKQYGLTSISAPQAWDVNSGDPGVIIAIVDTGIDKDHPELKDKLTLGYDFVNDDPDPDDDHGHGTHVAGIAGASTNNGIGIAGVCPECSLMPIKVLNGGGYGTIADVIKGIDFAKDNGADVINMSLGCNCPLSNFKAACDSAYNAGVVVVAAAGNANNEKKHYPAAFDSVIAVASLDSSDKKSSFSTYGTWVEISAPGSAVYSTYKGGGYRSLSGTSMASPHVAGVVGLIRSQFPELRASEVRNKLKQSVDDIYAQNPNYVGKLGTGKTNAYKAVLGGEEPPILHAEIFYPESGNVLKEKVVIDGKVFADVDTLYSLDYTKDGESNWSSDGITLPHGEEYQTEFGTIGEWDIHNLENTTYTLRLTVKEKANHENRVTDQISVVVANNLAWVVKTSGVPHSPTVGDVDNDGKKEVVVAAMRKVYLIDSEGDNIQEFEAPSITSAEPVFADLDNDGDLEILANGNGVLYAWHHTGGDVAGWPKEVPEEYIGSFLVSDLEGDGSLDIVAVAYNAADAGGGDSSVYVWESNGDKKRGQWPIHREAWPGNPAVGDLDGDGDLEIVSGSIHLADDGPAEVYVWHHDGSLLEGWPQEAERDVHDAAIGDIDGDGDLEIVTGGGYVLNDQSNPVFAWHHNGEPVANWPMYNRLFASDVSLADLDQDGDLEILVEDTDMVGGKIHAYNHTGGELEHWPLWVVSEWGSIKTPVIADVNGSGTPDVVTASSSGQVRAFTILREEIPLNINVGSTWIYNIAVDDIDGDNKVEIIVTTGDGKVYAWNLDSSYSPGAAEWPMYRHDERHTAAYELTSGPPPEECPSFHPRFQLYYGYVYIDGEPAPGDLPVRLYSPRNELVGCETTRVVDGKGLYPFTRAYGSEGDNFSGMEEGEAVTFKVNNLTTRTEPPEVIWRDGGGQQEVTLYAYTQTLPDLEVTGLKVIVGGEERTPKPGELADIQATVVNSGQQASGEFHRLWYINGDPETHSPVPSLGPGETARFTKGWVAEGGVFTFKFEADSKKEVEELSEENNTGEVTFRVPGLIVIPWRVSMELVKDYKSISGLTMKEALTITSHGATTWQLKNNQDATYTPPGGEPTPVVGQGFGFYESSGGISPGQDVKVRAYVNNNKDHGIYKGSYTLQEVEQGKAIDVQKVEYTLDVKEPPDLVALTIHVTKDGKEIDNPKEGDNLVLIAAMGNHGDVESGEFKYSWYIDGLGGVENVPHPSLPPVQAKSGANYAWDNVPAGEHTLKIVLDTLNEVKEKEENNNAFEKTINVKAAKADLKAERIKIMRGDKEAEPVVGEPVVLYGEFKNIGETQTVQFYVEWYKDGQKVDRYLHQVVPPDPKIIHTTQGYPWVVESGTHKFEFRLDPPEEAFPEGRVKEIDETNNNYDLVIVPKERADLEVSEIKIFKPGTEEEVPEEELKVGQLVTLFGVLKNIGGQDTGIFNVKWFKNEGQVGYGSHKNMPPDPKNFSRGNVRYDWTVEEGEYKFKFDADVDNHVGEKDEGNNNVERTITVTEPVKDNLVVRAKGSHVWNRWPKMRIRVNGDYLKDSRGRILTTTVGTEKYKDYEFEVPGITQADKVDVAFINDAYYWRYNQDRNLYVDYIEVAGRRIQAEDKGVYYDRGRGSGAFDWQDVIAGQEGMYWNGALRFNVEEVGILLVRAKGDPYIKYGNRGYGWPRMQIRVAGNYLKERGRVLTREVRNESYKDYIFVVQGISEGSKIDVAFINSYGRYGRRNALYVDYIEVAETVIQAEEKGVYYDKGRGSRAFDWQDVTDGQEEMYTSGALRFNTAGLQVLKVRAKGDPYWEYRGRGYWWPKMQIRVAGKYLRFRGRIQTTEVNTKEFKVYTFMVPELSKESKVDVAFINDRWNRWRKLDVNLFVDYIDAAGTRIQAEDTDVRYDRGSSWRAFDGQDVIPGQEGMYWNGALRFNQEERPLTK